MQDWKKSLANAGKLSPTAAAVEAKARISVRLTQPASCVDNARMAALAMSLRARRVRTAYMRAPLFGPVFRFVTQRTLITEYQYRSPGWPRAQRAAEGAGFRRPGGP